MAAASREDLKKQLEDIQRQHAENRKAKDYKSASVLYKELMTDTSSVGPSVPSGQSFAERTLADIAASKAQHPAKGHSRQDFLLMKDGLDMSFQNLCSDASRMRFSLDELGVQLGKESRQRAGYQVSQMAVPQQARDGYLENQQILVEQRRVLGQLRHESRLAEEEQWWVTRRNRQNWEGKEDSDLDRHLQRGPRPTPVEPHALEEAHSEMRRAPTQLMSTFGEQAPPQDGYLLAEIYSVDGFKPRDLIDADFLVSVHGPGQKQLAAARADGPLNPDGTIATRRIQVRIPAEDLGPRPEVRIVLAKPDQNVASARVALAQIGEEREGPKTLKLEIAEDSGVDGVGFSLDVALSAMRPSGPDSRENEVAHTRVATRGPAPWTECPGPELPPSQAYLAERRLAWERRGAPTALDVAWEQAPSAGFSDGYLTQSQLDRPPQQLEEAWSPSAFRGDGQSYLEQTTLTEPAEEPMGRTPRTPRSPGVTGQRGGASPPPPPGEAAFFAGFAEPRRVGEAPIPTRPPPLPVEEPDPPPAGFFAEDYPPFMAFAGTADARARRGVQVHGYSSTAAQSVGGATGSAQPVGGATGASKAMASTNSNPKMPDLRPPSRRDSIENVYEDLRRTVQAGQLGTPEAGQIVLEFAVKCSQAESIRPDAVSIYTAMMLDSMDKYTSNATLNLWIVEALIGIYRCSGAQREQLAVPLFTAFAACAARFTAQKDPAFHRRLLAALATVATPDCQVDTEALVGYTLRQLGRYGGRFQPLTAEHALGLLCICRSRHRVIEQVNYSLLMLRGFKADPHLAMRALVTVAELYEVIFSEKQRKAAARAAYALAHPDEPQAAPPLDEIPRDGVDVHLVTNVLGLYPTHRKVAGAGLRALAAMVKHSPVHLRIVAVEELPVLVQAQQRHAASRSVNLHVAEVAYEAAQRDQSMVTESLLMLVARVFRALPKDPPVAGRVVSTIRAVARTIPATVLLDTIPGAELVAVGKFHKAASAGVIVPLCDLFVALTESCPDSDLLGDGAMELAMAVLDAVPQEPRTIASAARLAKCLLHGGSPGAHARLAQLDGGVTLYNALSKYHESSDVVHDVLGAIASACQDPDVSNSLVDFHKPETGSVLDAILRAADGAIADKRVGAESSGASATVDADTLAQACCALGCLTSVQGRDMHEQLRIDLQQQLRMRIDRELLEQTVAKARAACPGLYNTGGLPYFEKLIIEGSQADLSPWRLLKKDGTEAVPIRPRKPPPDRQFAIARQQRGPRSRGKKPSPGAAAFDVYGPLRSLGVGGPAPARQPQGSPQAEPDPDPGAGGGFFGGGATAPEGETDDVEEHETY